MSILQKTGLYAISDDRLSDQDMINKSAIIIQHGAVMFQYRNKHDMQISTAYRLKALCQKYQVLLIINDNLNLAIEIDADGVHLGHHDSAIEQARDKIGRDKIIGVSCYDNLERAKMAEQASADYVSFGAFYPSTTKPDATSPLVNILTKARQCLSIAVVGIGGITINNGQHLLTAGADYLAVISDLYQAEDIVKQCQCYTKLFGD